jgi:hypothetical protein
MVLRFLRLEVSVHNVYITNQFQTTFARGWVKTLLEVTVNSKEKNSYEFCHKYVHEFGLMT